MTELARTASDGLVVSLHGQWGSGKTTFLSMWRQHLKTAGFKTINFNAWETDIADDAMVALLGELEAGLSDSSAEPGAEPSALQASVKAAKKIGGKLLRSAIPTAIRVATAGALDMEDLSEEIISDWTGKIAEEQVAAYESARRSIQAVRDSISEVSKAASAFEGAEEALPLVFIVDELDRCRPSYAVRVLECIKHFFAAPGVMFVLAVDSDQLSHAIRNQYGQLMDASGYLRRFFDLELSLPEPSGSDFSKAQFQRFDLDKVFEERRKLSPTDYERDNFLRTFEELFLIFRCSLRDRERCFTLLAFALRSTPKNHFLHPTALAALIVLKVKAPATYAQISQHTIGAKEVVRSVCERPGGSNFMESHLGKYVEASLYSVFAQHRGISEVIQELQLEVDRSAEPVIQERNKLLIQILQSREIRDMSGSLNYLLSKIDLVITTR